MKLRRLLALILAPAMLIGLVPAAGLVRAEQDTSIYRFDFGSAESPVADGYLKVTPESAYSADAGYGWSNTDYVTMEAVDEETDDALRRDYIKGNNARVTEAGNTVYHCPTFVLDVPNGVYQVRLIRGSAANAVCTGAYIEENFNAIPWFEDALPNVYTTEPSVPIVAPAGTYLDDTAVVAVWDGQLTVEIAASMTAAGESGVAVVNALEVSPLPREETPREVPNLYAVGDSTTATYPPFTNPDLTPIPEQTGWGAVLDRFFAPDVHIENWALGGMSAKNYLTEGYWNDVLLKIVPGDVVLIEWGINESAAGRRYIPANESYDAWMRRYTDAVRAFGGVPILVSGSKASGGYAERMRIVSEEDEVIFIDLRQLFSAYSSAHTSTQVGYLTIDGTHPSRVGGIVLAQIVTNEMKLSALQINAYNTAPALTPAGVAPTYIPENLRVSRQTRSSLTLAWDCPEEVMYAPDQLITRFPIYRREAGSSDEPVEYAEGTAYVLAGMEGPNCSITIEHTGEYEYFIAARGVNGTGEKSAALTVGIYDEPAEESIARLLEFRRKADPYDYQYLSFEAFRAAADAAAALLEDPDATPEALESAYAGLSAAFDALERIMDTYLYDDFQGDFAANWGTTPDPNNVAMTRILEEDGNRVLNYYVSASGERSRKKTFENYPSSSVTSAQFEWFSSLPDSRNVTELRFYSGSNNAATLFFGLKAASNGHIGYFSSNTPPDIVGHGFHEGSVAVDLGLPTGIWYLVNLEFDFEGKTAYLSLIPRDAADRAEIEPVVVEGIALPETATTLYSMRFHAARGKNDSGGNDLSVLWNTSFDNFGLYHLAPGYSVDTSGVDGALESAGAVDASKYTEESYAALAEAVAVAEYILGYRNNSQENLDYAAGRLLAAIEALEESTVRSLEVSLGVSGIVSGLAAYLSISVDNYSEAHGQLTAYLLVDGERLHATPITGGRGKMYIPVAPETAGQYTLLVTGESAEGTAAVTVREYNPNIWSVAAGKDSEGVFLQFNAKITVGGLTVNGAKTAYTVDDARDQVRVETDPGTGTWEFVASRVKLYELFPSYTFTYKATYIGD